MRYKQYQYIMEQVKATKLTSEFIAEIYTDGHVETLEGHPGQYLVKNCKTGAIIGILDEDVFLATFELADEDEETSDPEETTYSDCLCDNGQECEHCCDSSEGDSNCDLDSPSKQEDAAFYRLLKMLRDNSGLTGPTPKWYPPDITCGESLPSSWPELNNLHVDYILYRP